MGKEKWLPVCAGIMVSALFGLSFMFTASALDILSPMRLLGYRFAVAALVLTVLRAARVIRVDLKDRKVASVLLVALFQPVLYFLFETNGVRLTSASEAGMIMGLIPVVVVLLEMPYFRMVPTLKQLVAVLLSVSGVFFAVAVKGSLDIGYNPWGTAMLLGAVLSAGLYNIYSKKSSLTFSPVEITYIMMWTGAVLFNGLEMGGVIIKGELAEFFLPLRDMRVLGAVVYLGLCSSVVAFFLMNFMLSKIHASQTAIYVNLTTVVAILGGIFFRGDAFAWYQAVGAFLIILGVWGTAFYGKTETPAPTVAAMAGE